MRSHAPACLLGLALICAPVAPVARQNAPPLSDAAMEEFLRTARIVRTRDSGKGTTGSVRATLSDGTVTHDAHIQSVEVSKPTFRGGQTYEINFRDSWRFNIAVYRIDRVLGLHLVPVSVQRNWRHGEAAITWWVDDVLMDEGERLKKQIPPPDPGCWNDQSRMMRVLDQLIDNADRNLGNILITNTWRLWAIDHTRAFRYSKTPRNPAILTGIDRTVLQRLETLDFPLLKREIGQYVTDRDIRALLARRDGLVAHFKARGEAALFDRADPVTGCRRAARAACDGLGAVCGASCGVPGAAGVRRACAARGT
jgi:hypothetical protein